MKFYISSFVAVSAGSAGTADIASSITILVMLNFTPLVFCATLSRNRDTLTVPSTKKQISAIYIGKNVTSQDQKAYLYPIAFFWRRCLYAVITVYLFQWPQMQMIAHHALTVVYVSVLVYYPNAYDSKS